MKIVTQINRNLRSAAAGLLLFQREMTERDNALRTELKVGHVIVTNNVMLFPSHLSHFLSHCLL